VFTHNCIDSVLKHFAAIRKRRLSALPNVGLYIYIYTTLKFLALHVAPYIYDISRLSVKGLMALKGWFRANLPLSEFENILFWRFGRIRRQGIGPSIDAFTRRATTQNSCIQPLCPSGSRRYILQAVETLCSNIRVNPLGLSLRDSNPV
jgi:hypothetical protein